MQNNLDKIIQTLSEGLSESSVEEVSHLVNEVVEERVSEQMELLEAKVASFLRTKLDEMKDVAREEFEGEDTNARSMKVYDAIKTLVAAEIDGNDVDSVASKYEESINELNETIESLNKQISVSTTENAVLTSKMDTLYEHNSDLERERVTLEEQATLPFKSSESAVVITNDPDRKVFSDASSENKFLSEDVIRLSQLINTNGES